MKVDEVPPISSTTTGSVSTRPIQNRRVMSASSGFGPAVGGGQLRLERHAADRAAAGSHLPDLRMHRAGIDRAFRDGRRGLRLLGARYLRGSAANLVRHPAEQK